MKLARVLGGLAVSALLLSGCSNDGMSSEERERWESKINRSAAADQAAWKEGVDWEPMLVAYSKYLDYTTGLESLKEIPKDTVGKYVEANSMFYTFDADGQPDHDGRYSVWSGKEDNATCVTDHETNVSFMMQTTFLNLPTTDKDAETGIVAGSHKPGAIPNRYFWGVAAKNCNPVYNSVDVLLQLGQIRLSGDTGKVTVERNIGVGEDGVSQKSLAKAVRKLYATENPEDGSATEEK